MRGDGSSSIRVSFPSTSLEISTTELVPSTWDLLYSGRLHRFPGIDFILAHGGGTVPFMATRIAQGMARKAFPDSVHAADSAGYDQAFQGALHTLRSLYYDTAAASAPHLAALKEFVGPESLVFGTDGGWTRPIQTAQTIAELTRFDGFDESQLSRIEQGNLVELFPTLAGRSPMVPVGMGEATKGRTET